MQLVVVRGLKYNELRGLHGTSKKASQLAAGLAKCLDMSTGDFTAERAPEPKRYPSLVLLKLEPPELPPVEASSRRATHATHKKVEQDLKLREEKVQGMYDTALKFASAHPNKPRLELRPAAGSVLADAIATKMAASAARTGIVGTSSAGLAS